MMNIKILAVGVIVLFLGLACATSINANVRKNEKRIKPLDNGYFEIITYVQGVIGPLKIHRGVLFIYLHLEMWEYGVGNISIKAHTLNPFNPVYEANPKFIYAPMFIGNILGIENHDYYIIDGKFIGNIYWQ